VAVWTGMKPVHTCALSFLDGVIDEEYYHRANYCHNQTVDIEASYAVGPEETEQPPADNSADDSQNDVENKTFSRLVDDFTSDETCNQTQHDPRQN
jgi:hypothetical protein